MLDFCCTSAALFSHHEIGARRVGFVTMRFSSRNLCFLVLLLLAQTVVFTSSQDDQAVPCDPQCKTNNCDPDGGCRCDPPAPNNSSFLGGEFCDQPSHYCQVATDPTFWCMDNNGNNTCGTMADRSSTCICHAGYTGEQCDVVGTACGVGYCYNNATCLNGACGCLPEWKGSADCSLATPDDGGSGGSGIKWWGGLLISGAVVSAVCVGGIFGFKKYKERTEGASRFNELKKSQMRAKADSDEEYDSDPYEDEVHAKKSTTTARP